MIRLVTDKDLSICADVIRESFETVAREFQITQENAPYYVAFSLTPDKLKEQFADGRLMMVFCDEENKIVGYYSLCMLNNWECELNNLCVLPEYRNCGIGGQLLNHAFDEAKKAGCVKMNIGIVDENIVLRKWYEKYGAYHLESKKYDFFPFTCGYMEKVL